MTRGALRAVALLFSLSPLAGILAAGCRAPVDRPRESAADSFETVAAGVPDIRTFGGKVWFLERTQALSAYAVALRRTVPLQFRPHAQCRVFVLRGRVKVRVAGAERVLGAGAFVSVPRRVAYRIHPLEGEPPRLLMLFMPDSSETAVIEMPMIQRRLLSAEEG